MMSILTTQLLAVGTPICAHKCSWEIPLNMAKMKNECVHYTHY